MTAELWSNSSPICLEQNGTWYFPVFKRYPPATFGITDAMVVNYHELMNEAPTGQTKLRAWFPVNEWDPYEQTAEVLGSPSKNHWLGTDALGRDVFARLLYGIRISLAYGLLFWAACFGIGVITGLIQGYFAGSIDFVIERVKELIEILPFLSVVIILNGLMKVDSFWITLGVVVLFSWMGIASQLRSRVLSLRRGGYAESARALGASHSRILFKHILPNALTPILTLTPFSISSGISVLAVLDYLGFGLAPPTPSIGELLQQGRTYILNAPWILWAPTLALSLILISINLIGEALRDALSPK
jgi:microcin C transport system permease protein